MIIEKSGSYSILENFYLMNGLSINEINVFGIRNSQDMIDDVWNDILGIFTNYGKVYTWTGTTDPGVKATMHGRVEGAAHLALGYHNNIWQVGTHKKSNPNFAHTALVQTGNKVKIWRDKNKNFENDEPTYEEGWYGINFHRASRWSDVPTIGNYSAGCQVTQNFDDFNFAMDKILNSAEYLNDRSMRFSYMLFDESEIAL